MGDRWSNCNLNDVERKGLIGVDLSAKDGLSLINGTSQMCSFMVNADIMLENLLPIADLIACVSMEARVQ